MNLCLHKDAPLNAAFNYRYRVSMLIEMLLILKREETYFDYNDTKEVNTIDI